MEPNYNSEPIAPNTIIPAPDITQASNQINTQKDPLSHPIAQINLNHHLTRNPPPDPKTILNQLNMTPSHNAHSPTLGQEQQSDKTTNHPTETHPSLSSQTVNPETIIPTQHNSLPSNQRLNVITENRNISKGLKLSKMDTDGEMVILNEEDCMTLEEAWGFSLVGFLIGRLPPNASVLELANSWNVGYVFHEFVNGWIVFKFDNREDMNKVMELGPYVLDGRPLLLKEMPPYFRFEECCTSVD